MNSFRYIGRRQLETRGWGEYGCTLQRGRPRNVIFYRWLGFKLIGSILSARIAGRARVKEEPAGGSRGPRRPAGKRSGSSGGPPHPTSVPVLGLCPFIYPSENPENAPSYPGPKPGCLLPSGRGKPWNPPPRPPELGISTAQPWARSVLCITFPASYLVSCPVLSSHRKTAQGIFLNPKLSPVPPFLEPSMAPQCP